MKVFVTKANSDYWYEIRVFNTMNDIQNFIEKCHCGVIIEKNEYVDDKIFNFWDGMNPMDIPTIKECFLHLTIYNDWVE